MCGRLYEVTSHYVPSGVLNRARNSNLLLFIMIVKLTQDIHETV